MEQRPLAGEDGSGDDPLREALEQVVRSGRVDGIFGEPRMVGDTMLMPVAEVRYRGGGGAGRGVSGQQERGKGYGFGGTVTVRPVAVVVATAQGTRVVPIVDVGRLVVRVMVLGLAAMVLGRIFRRR